MARSVKFTLSSSAGDDHGTDTHAGEPVAPDAHSVVDDHRRFGDGTLWSFGGVEVVDIVQEPTRPIPIFRHVSPRHGGRVAVMFLLDGEVQVTHRDSHFHFLAGSAAYIVTGTATEVEASQTCHAVIVSLPRDRLEGAGVSADASFRAFAASTTRTSPLLTFALALIGVAHQNVLPAEPTASVLTDLVAGLFRADAAYSPTTLGSELDLEFDGYAETVRQFLFAQLDDPV